MWIIFRIAYTNTPTHATDISTDHQTDKQAIIFQETKAVLEIGETEFWTHLKIKGTIANDLAVLNPRYVTTNNNAPAMSKLTDKTNFLHYHLQLQFVIGIAFMLQLSTKFEVNKMFQSCSCVIRRAGYM